MEAGSPDSLEGLGFGDAAARAARLGGRRTKIRPGWGNRNEFSL